MAARQYRPIERGYLQLPVTVPVAAFLLALAAVLLQAGWWFTHGWAWSNLPRFLASGRPVAWCVVLILVGASLSWLGLRRAGPSPEGRGWAVAGLASSGVAAVPIMPEVLLLTILLLTVGSVVGRRPAIRGSPREENLWNHPQGSGHGDSRPDRDDRLPVPCPARASSDGSPTRIREKRPHGVAGGGEGTRPGRVRSGPPG